MTIKDLLLTYVVELKTRPTFTARRPIRDINQGRRIASKLKEQNLKAGYMKYSNFEIMSPAYFVVDRP